MIWEQNRGGHKKKDRKEAQIKVKDRSKRREIGRGMRHEKEGRKEGKKERARDKERKRKRKRGKKEDITIPRNKKRELKWIMSYKGTVLS